MKRKIQSCGSLITLTAFLSTMTSCATIFKGSTEKVSVTSEQQGAKVYVDGQYAGTTPVELRLESKRSHNIEIRKDGYQTRTYILQTSLGAGWLVLDIILIVGLIPIIVDAATGNWYELESNHVSGSLEPLPPTTINQTPPAPPPQAAPQSPPPSSPQAPPAQGAAQL